MKKRQGAVTRETIIQMRKKKDYGSAPDVSLFYQWTPNALTILRLLGTPLSVWIISKGQLTIAFWIFFAVCVTDWLDGYLARRWQVTSKLGQILDPLADKSLIISVYLALGLWGFIPMWLTILVLSRDFLILIASGGIILTQKTKVHLAPTFIGKISTTFQMLFIGLILAGGNSIPPILSIPASSIGSILMVFFLYGVALVTILSGITYARVAFNAFRKP